MHNRWGWRLVAVMASTVAGASSATAQIPEGGEEYGAGAPTDAVRIQEEERHFWEALGDPALGSLLDAALEGGYDLRASRAQAEGADASHLNAALELAPIVTARAGYTRRRFSSYAFPGTGAAGLPDQDVWETGLAASWDLDVFGRLRGRLRASGALVDAADARIRETEITLAAGVARSYFELRGLQEQLDVARRSAENQRNTLELVEQRLDGGRGTEFDAARARAQLASTLASIPMLEAEIEAVRADLAVLVGRDLEELDVELGVHRPLPRFPGSLPSVRTADVIRSRPDVRGAEARVAATRGLARSARAGYLPRLSIEAFGGYTAESVGAFGNTGTFNYTVGPVLSWAAFDLGRVKARVDEAHAREEEERAYRDQAVLRAEQELEAATDRYTRARARLDHLVSAADASARAAELARLRYDGGVADFLQVLDAERTSLAAQDDLARARTAVAEAYVELYEARGGIWGR